MKRIYVTFGNLVVHYEIKGLGTQFVETERIQVEKTVMGIAKVTDGFFTVNEFLVSFRWRDFSINSDLPYVKLGERPLICSSICVKKGGILHRMQCPSHGHCRKRVVGVFLFQE